MIINNGTITEFGRTSAHEFGHQVLGLGDAYYDDKLLEPLLLYPIYPTDKDKDEVRDKSLMHNQWDYYFVHPNDIEMVLLAHSTGKQQQYRLLNLSEAFYE